MNTVDVRLMRADDLPKTERASDETFLEAGRRDRRVSDPEPVPRPEPAARQWIDRMRFFLGVDPGGCWVAADGDDIVGFAISQNGPP